MITSEVTLVLGAGASAHLNFPSGEKLAKIICEGTRPNQTLHNLLLSVDCDAADIKAFHCAFSRSGALSIDAFLDHRAEFVEIGKKVIAASLVEYENPESLFVGGSENWYYLLFSKMRENTAFNYFGECNKVRIVTFNYDRSLEFFLFSSLKNLYGKTNNEVAAQLNKIQIIHVHGKLGGLPWQTENCRQYRTTTTPYDITAAADGIRMVHEPTPDLVGREQCWDIFKKATKLCFLGFGYDPENLRCIGCGKLRQEAPPRRFGTAYGLTEKMAAEIESKYSIFNLANNRKFTVVQFLKENPEFLVGSPFPY